jgi:hypothetical protein
LIRGSKIFSAELKPSDRENGFAAGYCLVNTDERTIKGEIVEELESGSMGISDMMFIAKEFSALIVPESYFVLSIFFSIFFKRLSMLA